MLPPKNSGIHIFVIMNKIINLNKRRLCSLMYILVGNHIKVFEGPWNSLYFGNKLKTLKIAPIFPVFSFLDSQIPLPVKLVMINKSSLVFQKTFPLSKLQNKPCFVNVGHIVL